ncbi:MAG TPA: alanine racemase [Candidatus Saccharimonadales bacterium]|nr:alanine racemase [Candidatus Saccharimonadales bacterium]
MDPKYNQSHSGDFASYNRIEVSRSALLHNLAVFKKHCTLHIMPVLKNSAYGHGIEAVVEALQGEEMPYIIVNTYEEALRVRAVSQQPVLIMGVVHPNNFARLQYQNFAFVVQDAVAIEALARTGQRINVHLEYNTGMNRYGAQPNEVVDLTRLILQHKSLTLEGVMSHLADADNEDSTKVKTAIRLFDACVEHVRQTGAHPTLIHLAATAGCLHVDSQYANSARIGKGLYGINPFKPSHRLYATLQTTRLAIRVISTIVKIQELQAGDSVGYGPFVVPKAMRIGILPIGYAEGADACLEGVGVVKIGSHHAPVIGRVGANHMAINLGGINARIGDEVIVDSDDRHDKNARDQATAEYHVRHKPYRSLNYINRTLVAQ